MRNDAQALSRLPGTPEVLQIGSVAFSVGAAQKRGFLPGTQAWPFLPEQATGRDQGSSGDCPGGGSADGCFRFTGRVSSPGRSAALPGRGLGVLLSLGSSGRSPCTWEQGSGSDPAEAT